MSVSIKRCCSGYSVSAILASRPRGREAAEPCWASITRNRWRTSFSQRPTSKVKTKFIMSDKKLNRKIALITGASKGLGRAMAIALGAAGARLVLASRDVAQLEETKTLVEATGSQAHVFRADVTHEAEVLQLEKDVSAQVG